MRQLAFYVLISALVACSVEADPWDTVSGLERPDCAAELATAEGKVTGAPSTTGGACEYRGLRYAAPPVGDLRFAPPAPAPKHAEVKAATVYGPQCLQKYGIDQMGVDLDLLTVGKEDCLFLNVWRPVGERLPVMVFIHGGAFVIGGGSWGIYDGDLLSQEGVVVVTINYRLGPLGFLAYPAGLTDGVAGNQGILDQIAALRWVKDNIAAFGGDPGNVTVFGESAGGMSVCTLLASPEARGLFHAAIIESGGCKAVAELSTGYAHAVSYAADVGCAGATDKLACMRQVPAVDLMKDMQFDVILSALEPHVEGEVVPQIPLEQIRAGTFNKVPLLAGSNANEVKIVAMTNLNNLKLKNASWGEFYEGLDATFGVTDATQLRKFYGQEDFATPFDAWFMLKTDMVLGCPTLIAAQSVAEQGVPAYHYVFNWDDLGSLSETIGAVHGLELFFVFGTMKGLQPIVPEDQFDGALRLSKRMRQTWANFARNHAPSADGLPEWPRVEKGTVVLDVDSAVDLDIKRDACAWWDARLPVGLENQTQGFHGLVENYPF